MPKIIKEKKGQGLGDLPSLPLMMHKIVSELIVHARANWCTWRTKKKQPTESTDAVPAKNPPKIKLVAEEYLRTQ